MIRFELIDKIEPTPTPKEVIVHCLTEELYKRVCKKLGVEENNWSSYKEKTCVHWSYKDKKYNFCNEIFYKEKYPNVPIISAEEFLGGEKNKYEEVKAMFDLSPYATHPFESAFTSEYTCDYGTNLSCTKELNNNKSIIKKSMSLMKNAMKSKENKALEYFGLGDTKELNEDGRNEFVDYIYETGDNTRKGFLEQVVKLWKEKTKK